jgi:hypothetical protein
MAADNPAKENKNQKGAAVAVGTVDLAGSLQM